MSLYLLSGGAIDGEVAVTISLSDDERAELESCLVVAIVLAAAAGCTRRSPFGLEVSADTVGKWRRRYAGGGPRRSVPNPAPARRVKSCDDAIAEAVRLTLEETPPDATHWSLRSMARASGHAPSTIHRIGGPSACSRIARRPSSCRAIPSSWRRSATGLYLAPPDRALVLCVDEKSQIQALDRSQPLLLSPGQAERRNDYKDGTTSLFAALDIATPSATGQNKTKAIRDWFAACPSHPPCRAWFPQGRSTKDWSHILTVDQIAVLPSEQSSAEQTLG